MLTINLDDAARAPITGHTSKGDQPKWQVGGKWYKADHMGHEALSEVLVAGLLKKSNVKEYVDYQPAVIEYDGKTLRGCVSRNFRGKDEMLIPFERLHRAYKGRGLAQTIGGIGDAAERIRYTVDFIEQTTGLSSVGNDLTMLLELDAFFLNEDRHTNNLAVIRNEEALQFRLCPIFDNGLALLSDWNDYPADADLFQCISRVRAKPFAQDFDEQVDAANALYGSRLKFSFTKADVKEILKNMSGVYPDDLLRRAEMVVYEQMRKYSVYF